MARVLTVRALNPDYPLLTMSEVCPPQEMQGNRIIPVIPAKAGIQ